MDSLARPNPRITDRLHPLIYMIIAGLALWFVLSAWVFFGGAGYIELALAVASVLLFMAFAIPFTLWRAGVKAQKADPPPEAGEEFPETFVTWIEGAFVTWIEGAFETWTGQQTSASAAVEILLPIAAVALGLMALGIVFELAATGKATDEVPATAANFLMAGRRTTPLSLSGRSPRSSCGRERGWCPSP